MRLIDADVLNSAIFEIGCHKTKMSPMEVMDIINKQPIAYDVEKVGQDMHNYLIKIVGKNSALYRTILGALNDGGVK